MSKYLSSILSVLAVVATFLAPQIQSVISAHPLFATVFAAVVAILNHFLPSPVTAAPAAK